MARLKITPADCHEQLFSALASPEGGSLLNSTVKTILFWVFILICCFSWEVVRNGARMGKDTEIAYPDLLDKVHQGAVLDAVIQGNELHGHLKATPKAQFHSTVPANNGDLEKALLAANINFSIKQTEGNMLWPPLFNLGPLLLLFILLVPPFWAIFKKAGFSAWLALLILIPLVNLILLYVVAFSKWKAVSTPEA
jgi:ATP-dependent Zn protease